MRRTTSAPMFTRRLVRVALLAGACVHPCGRIQSQEPGPAPTPARAADPRLLLQRAELQHQRGDLDGALATYTEVEAAWAAARASSDPGLLGLRGTIALLKKDLGDLAGALALEEGLLSTLLAQPGADEAFVQRVRLNLATTKLRLGDLDGALALQEVAVAALAQRLPEDAIDLQRARVLLAATRAKLGDHAGARTLFDGALAVYERALPPDSADLRLVRDNLAQALMKLGDLSRAASVLTQVLATSLRHDDPDGDSVQRARKNLAIVQRNRGELAAADELLTAMLAAHLRRQAEDAPEVDLARDMLCSVKHARGDHRQAVPILAQLLASRLRTRPRDHEHVLQVRRNLAIEMTASGDLAGACEHEREILAARLRTLEDSHPLVQEARSNLGVTLSDLGDRNGALALQEKVVAVLAKVRPETDPDLLSAWQNLGITRAQLGDLPGALALSEKVLALREATAEPGDVLVDLARWNVAANRFALGDREAALAAMEQVHEALFQQLSEADPRLQHARSQLALQRRESGDLAGALALEEQALAGYARIFPADHPSVLNTLQNVGEGKFLAGDLEGATAIFAGLLREHADLAGDHPQLQDARYNLAWARACAGDEARVAELMRQLARAHRHGFDTSLRAPRELGAVAVQAWRDVAVLCSYVAGCGLLSPLPALAEETLLLAEACRGLETRAARWLRRGLSSSDRQRVAPIDRELRRIAGELAAVGTGSPAPAAGSGDPEAERSAREERRRALVERRDLLQRELLALVTEGGGVATSRACADDLARALPPKAAAVTFLGYEHMRAEPERFAVTERSRRMLALIVRPAGKLEAVALGDLPAIEALVARLRAGVAAGADPERARASEAAARALRRAVLDPVLAVLPDVATLYVSADEALQLVPLDSLPADDGQPVGARVGFRYVVSLLDLLDREPALPAGTGKLVAFGDLAYDEATPARAEAESPAALPPTTDAMRGGEPMRYGALAATAGEVDAIAERFAQCFPAGRAELRRGSRGGKAELFALAGDCRFLHLATHGYFAPEWVVSAGDGTERFALPTMDQHRGAAGLSPYVLSGLALSGANLPPGERGGHQGIVTAEECLQLDLSACELVVLSACDTSAGVRRAGQGYASLRAAFRGAGARCVLSSLWKVGDAATQEFMRGFYRALWEDGRDPASALWATKAQAFAARKPFRDWAGWVLTGG